MAIYDKEEIFEKATKIAKDKKLLFVKDVIDNLPLSQSTFYDYFPAESEESEALRQILDKNKVNIKTALRAQWLQSDNATMQLALYRLCASPDEHKMLNQKYVDHTSGGEKISAEDKSVIIYTANSKSFDEEE